MDVVGADVVGADVVADVLLLAFVVAAPALVVGADRAGPFPQPPAVAASAAARATLAARNRRGVRLITAG
jgi:hypothetical protein